MSLVKWVDRKFAPLSHTIIENFFTDATDFSNSISKGLTIPAINIRKNERIMNLKLLLQEKVKMTLPLKSITIH